MYGGAAEMMQPETPVIVALPDHGRRSHAHQGAGDLDEAEDVVVKPAPRRQSLKTKPLRKRTKETASQPQRLSSNDEKVLAHLKKVLDRRSWVTLTQGTIAQGAGIPLGSVGLAMRRLVAAEAVRERGKGTYRLA
jgi:DNA-directed RNA polymerase specialized sigma24 family protein